MSSKSDRIMKRWQEQRWLLDTVIRTVGMEWDQVRIAYQDGNMTQGAAASGMRLSRPALANALQGRFGLSADRVEAVKAFLSHPPPVVQPRLI